MNRLLRRAAASLALVIAAPSCTPPTGPVLTASETSDVAHIETYLNAIPRFEAHFTQTGSFGPGAGLVWLDRPGHLRIDYAGPASRLMVIADGRVNILDRGTGALTTQPVSRTPLGLLLAPTISLSGAAKVESLTHANGQLRLVLSKTDQPGQGRLTLDFAGQPLLLEAVTITDPYGRMLTMQLSMIDPAPILTPDLFQMPAQDSPS